MNYWLFKSEPDDFSINDLAAAGTPTRWNGIRNYQARNFIRDALAEGDGVLFYHSSCKVPAIVGTAIICCAASADESAFDQASPYFDAKSTRQQPRWYAVDIRFHSKFKTPITLRELKQDAQLSTMYLINKGARLSIQPVSAAEWQYITQRGAAE